MGSVLPTNREAATSGRLEAARTGPLELDRKIRDAVLTAATHLPAVLEKHGNSSRP